MSNRVPRDSSGQITATRSWPGSALVTTEFGSFRWEMWPEGARNLEWYADKTWRAVTAVPEEVAAVTHAPSAGPSRLLLADGQEVLFEAYPLPEDWEPCRIYWGSHGCDLPRGHFPATPHECACCECEDHERDHEDEGCVARTPYYGPETRFYGEDVTTEPRHDAAP